MIKFENTHYTLGAQKYQEFASYIISFVVLLCIYYPLYIGCNIIIGQFTLSFQFNEYVSYIKQNIMITVFD